MFRNYDRIASAVLLSLVVLRLILRALSPHSYLVPDEYTWSNLAIWLVEGKDLTKFDGFDRSPFYGAQSLVAPSAWQVEFLNISGLNAVRNTSLLYGIGSLLVFFYAIKLISRSNFSSLSRKQFSFAMGILLIYGLMPSHLFWSLVGLRDSASEFFVLLTVFFVCKSLIFKKWRWYALPLVTLFLIISFSARAQTAWVLCALVGIVGAISVFTKAKRPELVIFAIGAFFVGQLFSEIPEKVLTKEVVITQGDKYLTLIFENNTLVQQKSNGLRIKIKEGKLVPIDPASFDGSNINEQISVIDVENASEILELIGDTDSGSDINYTVKERKDSQTNVLQGTRNPIDRLGNLENERAVKRVDAESVISKFECKRSGTSSLNRSLCLIEEAIYQFFSFLFRPFFFETSASLEFKFAAYENILWLTIFISLLIFWMRLRWRPNQLDLIPMIFFMLFAPAAAMTQGNLGTAMRHKSIVLWTLLWIALSMYFYHHKKITTRQVASEIDR
jgi:hypothetical protein